MITLFGFPIGGCYTGEMNDSELLRSYAAGKSEEAFSELVRRYVDLVFSAALRQAGGDRHLAQDVTQIVFNDLARKANSLSSSVVLAGWLYTSTRFAAAKALRTENRRRLREQQASFMADHFEPHATPTATPHWDQLQTVLDDAMHELNQRDRDAILLRFFERHDFQAVGEKIGASPDAARMRVERALEKLRSVLGKRGIVSTSGALALALSQQAVTAAPVTLAATVAASALGTAAGAAPALTLLQIMTMTKIKTGVAALAIAGLSVPLVMQYQAHQELKLANQQLARQYAAAAAEIEPLKQQVARLSDAAAKAAQATGPSNELYRLRAEVTRLREEARDTARARAIAAAVPGDDPVHETLRTLGQRAAQLKKRFAQMPETHIPELEFIDEKDWLDAAGQVTELRSDSDYRRALNTLRTAAKQKAGRKFQDALRKFSEANNDLLPSDLSQLQPHFDSPVDPAVLQRYKLAYAGKYSEAPGDQNLIVEAAPPVDEEYDTRIEFRRNGTTTRTYNAIDEAIEQAATAYAQANNGLLPRQAGQLQPYLQRAVHPEQIQQKLNRIPPGITTLEEFQRKR